jgi:uncharacterized membrane protein YcaP (DUF421 family)
MQQFFNNDYVQIALRCMAVYLFIVLAIRVFGKKELAQLSVIDLVFILLISNAVQNAMLGNNNTLYGGLFAAISLFCINFCLKKILFKSSTISELLQGKNLLLVYKGAIQQDNLNEAEITIQELQAAIREHGVEKIQQVDMVMLEVDGNISVISNNYQQQTNHQLPNYNGRKKHRVRGRFK